MSDPFRFVQIDGGEVLMNDQEYRDHVINQALKEAGLLDDEEDEGPEQSD
jgi:hypothetical protein